MYSPIARLWCVSVSLTSCPRVTAVRSKDWRLRRLIRKCHSPSFRIRFEFVSTWAVTYG